jgi:hypothetical protein
MTDLAYLITSHLLACAIGLTLGWIARTAKADRDAKWAFMLSEKRANWQYHQGCIDTMNALEPKRDKNGRYVTNKTIISKE